MEWLLGFAIVIAWRMLVRSHRRAVAGIVRPPRVKQIVTPTMPPFDDSPPFTLAQSLQWVPPSIAEDFGCVRGPHEWLNGGHRLYCKHCPASRRLMEV